MQVAAFDRIPERSEWSTPWGGPPDVRSLAVSPGGAIYADIHVGWIVRSTDGGTNWSPCRNGLEKDVHQVATHPNDLQTVFASTARGFYISHDSGDTFARKSEPMPYYYGRACTVFPDSEVYLVSTSKGPHGDCAAKLFRSVDGGDTWAEVEGLPDEIHNNIDTYQLACSEDGRAVAVVRGTDLYSSINFGRTFEKYGSFSRIHVVAWIS